MSAQLSRRTLLRGAGAALSLPLLQAMVPARRTTFEAPRRICFVYVPNGVHMSDWTPGSLGEEFELPPLLQPLAPFRADLCVLSGLVHDKARPNGDGPGDHARAAATFLTGCQALKTDGAIRAGVSVDQLVAQSIGHATRLRSIEVGTEAGRLAGQCDSGYSCAYSNSISWSTPHTPLCKETDPRLLFDRLFGDGESDWTPAEREARRARRRSVLDVVGEDARRLAGKLGAEDRRKLDEFQSGVRELERRIQYAAGRSKELGLERPDAAPDGFAAQAQLQADLIALAFRTDTTRVATWMLANEGSGRSYPEVGAPEGHHELSHHGGDGEKLRKIAAINRLHVEQLAHLLARLAEAEGDARVLDACIVAYGSAISDGDRHNHDELPILVAGGGGTLQRNRHVRVAAGTPCANLWVSLAGRMGVAASAIGDSTGPLAELG